MGKDKKTRSRAAENIKAAARGVKNVSYRTMTEMTSISSLNKEEQSTYSKLRQSGVIEPISTLKGQTLDAAQELNGGRSQLYKNLTETRNLAMGLGVEFVVEHHNKKVMKKLISAKEDEVSVESLIEANSYISDSVNEGIFDAHAVKSYSDKDIINNNHRNEVIKKIRSQSNRLANKKYGFDFNRMSSDKLKELYQKSKANGNKELEILAKNEIGLRELKGGNSLQDAKMSRHTLSRMTRSNFRNIDEYNGLQELKKYQKGISMSIRLGARYYGMVAQAVYNPISNIHETGVKIFGAYNHTDKAAINEKVQKIRKFRGNINDGLSGRTFKRIHSDVTEQYGSVGNAAVQKSKVAAKKLGNRIADSSELGKRAKAAYKKTTKTTNRFWKPFKQAKDGFFGFGQKLFSKILDIKRVIKKVIMSLIVGGAGGLVILTAAAGLIVLTMFLATTIAGALDQKAEETSMGIAYTKLLEKEEKFSNTLTSLYMKEKPVGMLGYYEAASGEMVPKEIPKYTKSTVEYYNGDGEELENGQTIKGILAMAAVYIDQDFEKYGHKGYFLGEVDMDNTRSLLGSTYKDYVAALYDSTHLIGMEKDDQEKVYYCEDRNEAPSDCNNVITGIDHGSRVDEIPDNCDSEHCSERHFTETVNAGTDEEGNSIEEEIQHIEYTCTASHRRCGGHIDLTADVLISNIYYPESEDDPIDPDSQGDPGEEAPENETDETPEEIHEMAYSMYALDKYANIFDENEDSSAKAAADANMDRDNSDSEGSREPHTEILDIMNDVIQKAGKDAEIDRYVYWPNNDPVPWDRHPTYYYMKSDGDINEDVPINETNGTPYRFVSYTSENNLNPEFASHGWDKDSREWVQALLIPSWKELYGLSNFGCLTGTPLSQEQIEALIASNPEWADLSEARKLLMALSMTLPQGHAYSKNGQPTGKYAATSQPAMSCAGYVRWLYWSAFDMEDFPGYTETINAQLQNNPKWEHYVGAQNMDKLEPGDIILRRDGGSNPATGQWNHVLIYAGHNEAGQRVYFHESGSAHGYKQLSTYNFSNPNTIQIYKLKGIDDMQIDYGINTSGSLSVNVSEVGEILNIDGDELWIGWEHNESGGEGARQAGGDNGYAFGMFQLDSRFEDLYIFMQRCVDDRPDLWSEFKPYIAKKKTYLKPNNFKGNLNTLPKLGNKFEDLWRDMYDKDPERFRELQLSVFYDSYMSEVKTYAKKENVDLDEYSPVMKGTLWSIAIFKGSQQGMTGPGKNASQEEKRKGYIGALKVIKNGEEAGKTEKDILIDVYNDAAKMKKGIEKRWEKIQKAEALAVYEAEYE